VNWCGDNERHKSWDLRRKSSPARKFGAPRNIPSRPHENFFSYKSYRPSKFSRSKRFQSVVIQTWKSLAATASSSALPKSRVRTRGTMANAAAGTEGIGLSAKLRNCAAPSPPKEDAGRRLKPRKTTINLPFSMKRSSRSSWILSQSPQGAGGVGHACHSQGEYLDCHTPICLKLPGAEVGVIVRYPM